MLIIFIYFFNIHIWQDQSSGMDLQSHANQLNITHEAHKIMFIKLYNINS